MGTIIISGSNLVDTISSIFLTYFVAAYVRRFKCNFLFLHSFNKQATINYTKRFLVNVFAKIIFVLLSSL